MPDFSSEGFDIDASGGNTDDVIFEIGGGSTVVPKVEEAEAPTSQAPSDTPPSLLDQAEEWKQRGNEEFKKKNYLEAYDMYTNAIEVCPCPVTVDDILRQRDEFDEMEREKMRLRMEEETRQRRRDSSKKPTNNDPKEENTKTQSSSAENTEGPRTFELEPQEHSEKLAIFLNNRSASLIQLERTNRRSTQRYETSSGTRTIKRNGSKVYDATSKNGRRET
ncbi:unnamed protein product [Pseudo-nitzschia multistriata]|uniref:Uncharacterized protein n=1 Tax=Pseudo-nitzschia multistriata TaxID=183589 RepID=A0A448YUQ3_9STRA|nr:unnamed protein product [Pseudo-nitzschia multistriata]